MLISPACRRRRAAHDAPLLPFQERSNDHTSPSSWRQLCDKNVHCFDLGKSAHPKQMSEDASLTFG